MRAGLRRDGAGIFINASRSIATADDPGTAARKLRDQINRARSEALGAKSFAMSSPKRNALRESLPAALEWFANVNPFTTFVDALRHLWLGTPANSDVLVAFVWVVVILAIFAPLAARRYRQAVTH